MRQNRYYLSIIWLVCISVVTLSTAHAGESFSMIKPTIEGANDSSAPSSPSVREETPSDETTTVPSPSETNAFGFAAPRIAGFITKELQETGMAVIIAGKPPALPGD